MFFKELIYLIYVFEFMTVEFFIVLPYYSFMGEGSVVISISFLILEFVSSLIVSFLVLLEVFC